jgi:chorismate--pyruvate lyase
MKLVHWVNEIAALSLPPSMSIAKWLTQPIILSHALKRHCQQLSVEVLSQQFMAVDDTESLLREQVSPEPFVRRVLLHGDNQPWTYGRVVIAPRTYQAYFSQFIALGAKLLGETLLYGNPDTTRSPFEYAIVPQESALYQEIRQRLPLTQTTLWARRSYFYLKQAPLLVTEVFLPLLPDYDAV